MKNEFLKEFEYRGYMNDCTNPTGLDDLFNEEKVIAYIGFDMTAKSLHVGSLMQIMILRLMQKHGHKPIVLLGGGTTRIGDPSGKDKTRNALTDQQIEENKESLKRVFSKFLKFGDGPSDAIMIDNSEWLANINYLDFLRDIGRHFSINRMMSFDSVKLRLEREQPLTFLEFNYMILQAYDFTVLNKKYGCRLQFGGSDQWGNIVNGIDLNRKLGQKEVFGLTSPLLTTASGAKMGKTESGAVWLNDEMLSAYDYWQFWRNVEDADTIKFIKMFTDLSQSEIGKLEKLEGKELNDAKIILANETTKLCHGEKASKLAAETAKQTFAEGALGAGLPEFSFTESELNETPIYKIIPLCEMCGSGGEAKRLVAQNAVKLNNDNLITEIDYKISSQDFDSEGKLKLSVGKKKHVIIKLG